MLCSFLLVQSQNSLPGLLSLKTARNGRNSTTNTNSFCLKRKLTTYIKYKPQSLEDLRFSFFSKALMHLRCQDQKRVSDFDFSWQATKTQQVWVCLLPSSLHVYSVLHYIWHDLLRQAKKKFNINILFKRDHNHKLLTSSRLKNAVKPVRT